MVDACMDEAVEVSPLSVAFRVPSCGAWTYLVGKLPHSPRFDSRAWPSFPGCPANPVDPLWLTSNYVIGRKQTRQPKRLTAPQCLMKQRGYSGLVLNPSFYEAYLSVSCDLSPELPEGAGDR